nr:SGNH/GDSL hydrolase family protein [Phaeobacter marinintestinus]
MVLGLAGCLQTVSRDNPSRILAMGDSLMSWHLGSTNSITDAVANELGEPVVNRSVGGARVLYGLPVTGALGMKIENQYAKGDWDWVVLNGGGNDLWLGCGCFACDGKLDKLIAPDGRRGEIARMVWELRETGARVIYVGYLRSPGRGSVIEHCRDEGEELEARIDRLAALLPGVYFLSLADLVPHGDRSYHSADMIHPSIKASTEIGKRVAALIEAEEAVQ